MTNSLEDDSDKMLNRKEAAEKLGTTPGTLATWVRKKDFRLPIVKVGNRMVRYRLSDIRDFLRRQTISAIEK